MLCMKLLLFSWGGGGTIPYWNRGGNFRSIDPWFWHVPIPLGPFVCPTRSYWPPLSAEKIGLSLSHLVPEIIWPKVGLIFHKNLLFDHFAPIFSFIFDLVDPLLQFLNLFDPSFLQNLRSCWVHFFIVCWTPLLKICWSATPRTQNSCMLECTWSLHQGPLWTVSYCDLLLILGEHSVLRTNNVLKLSICI